MVRRTVSWVISQTYSGFVLKCPVSVTHMAAQAWQISFSRQPAQAPGRRIRSVAALVRSHAWAKPSSGTENSGCVIMPQGVMPPCQLIQKALRPARQATPSPGVPSQTSSSDGRASPCFMAWARCRNCSGVSRSRSHWTLYSAAWQAVNRSLLPTSASSRRIGGNM